METFISSLVNYLDIKILFVQKLLSENMPGNRWEVNTAMVLYGEMLITQNFHNLIHITKDAEYFSKK